MSASRQETVNDNANDNPKTAGRENADLDRMAAAAAEKTAEFERLLESFKPFLRNRASKLAGVAYDAPDEMMSAAMSAFHEAVKAYDPEKGHFFRFMDNVVRMRLIDCWRRLSADRAETVPLEEEYDGESGYSRQVAAASLRNYDDSVRQRGLVLEIESFKQEIAEWGFSMDALVEHSPKQARTRTVYKEITGLIAADEEIMCTIRDKHYYPVKKISRLTKLPRKLVERARIYTIASLIIRSGDYDYLKSYVVDG